MKKRQGIEYCIQTASEDDIFSHLIQCNAEFMPPLDRKVDIKNYSVKIFNHALTFEAWHNSRLTGLIAAYFNKPEIKIGFITSVSVLSEFAGKGIASHLIDMTVNYARQNKYSEIELEVSASNNRAINLYLKHGFRNTEAVNENLRMSKILQHSKI